MSHQLLDADLVQVTSKRLRIFRQSFEVVQTTGEVTTSTPVNVLTCPRYLRH